jgi:hypothetical protein
MAGKLLTEKICKACRKMKPRGDYYVHRSKGRVDKIHPYCKPCANKRTAVLGRKCGQAWKEFAGGECVRCGYNWCQDALDFHHRDPSKKEYQLAPLIHGCMPGRNSATATKIYTEILKCDLVCANCHREIHSNCTKHL